MRMRSRLSCLTYNAWKAKKSCQAKFTIRCTMAHHIRSMFRLDGKSCPLRVHHLRFITGRGGFASRPVRTSSISRSLTRILSKSRGLTLWPSLFSVKKICLWSRRVTHAHCGLPLPALASLMCFISRITLKLHSQFISTFLSNKTCSSSDK